jgi:hypothetical protein
MTEVMNPRKQGSKQMSEDTYVGPDGKRYPLDVECTRQGLQLVLGAVRPQSMKDKVQYLAEQPMQPRKRQKPCDVGLFDTESRKQLNLFDSHRGPATRQPPSPGASFR